MRTLHSQTQAVRKYLRDSTAADSSNSAPDTSNSDSTSNAAAASGEATASTRETSASEGIYKNPLGPQQQQPAPENEDMAAQITPEVQAMIDRIVEQALTRHAERHAPQPGQPGPQGEQGEPGIPGPPGPGAIVEGNGRWYAPDLGYFDPNFDGKSIDTAPAMEHAGKDTYFRDVFAFIDRIHDIARTKGAKEVRENIQLSLRGTALEWYTSELTDGEKRLGTYGEDTTEWDNLLLRRFKPARTIGMSVILKERYTLMDASKHREPREFAQTILRAAKTAELGDLPHQLLIIWNALDLDFQRDIPEPSATTSLNTFLESLDARKHQWWAIGSRTQVQPPFRRQQMGQYGFGRPAAFGYGRGGTYYPPGPKQSNANSYASLNPRYNAYDAQQQQYTQPFAQQRYQPPQRQYQEPTNANAAQLPAPPPRNLIAAGPSGQARGSGSPLRPNYNSGNRGRPWQGNRSTRVYHGETLDENEVKRGSMGQLLLSYST